MSNIPRSDRPSKKSIQTPGSSHLKHQRMPQHRRHSELEAFRSAPTGSPECYQNVGEGERLISLGAGGLLALLGLARGGLRGLALAAIGGSLAYRGYTGYCHAYAALGVNTA